MVNSPVSCPWLGDFPLLTWILFLAVQQKLFAASLLCELSTLLPFDILVIRVHPCVAPFAAVSTLYSHSPAGFRLVPWVHTLPVTTKGKYKEL